MALIGAAAVLLAGCAGSAASTEAQAGELYAPEIDPARFSSTIDHPFLPLTPGTTFVYEGISDGESERIEVTVTGDTRRVMGVECVVVRDTVTVNGEVIEDTYDWYAQDADGNVWYFGEDSRTFEGGVQVSTEGSWEAGVDGALPGILMRAAPQVGDSYRQEYYPGVAEDMAEVLSLTESETVAYGSFDGLLMTREWTPLEPGVAEQKYYARGVGLVLEVMVEGGEGRVELIEVRVE
jgi:hypothetical protein